MEATFRNPRIRGRARRRAAAVDSPVPSAVTGFPRFRPGFTTNSIARPGGRIARAGNPRRVQRGSHRDRRPGAWNRRLGANPQRPGSIPRQRARDCRHLRLRGVRAGHAFTVAAGPRQSQGEGYNPAVREAGQRNRPGDPPLCRREQRSVSRRGRMVRRHPCEPSHGKIPAMPREDFGTLRIRI
jgi:hypothetical protein